jgi:hypothetical protein
MIKSALLLPLVGGTGLAENLEDWNHYEVSSGCDHIRIRILN